MPYTVKNKAIFGGLPSGIQYILYPTQELEERILLSVQISARANDNPQGQYGMAHLIEHLILDAVRTELNTASRLSNTIDLKLGHDIDGVIDFETTTYFFTYRHISQMLLSAYLRICINP